MRRSSTLRAYWAQYYNPKAFRCVGQRRAVVPEGAGTQWQCGPDELQREWPLRPYANTAAIAASLQ